MPSSATRRPCSMTIASTFCSSMPPTRTRIERHEVDRDRAARGLRGAAAALAVVDAAAASASLRRERDGGGAGVDQEAHRAAVDVALGDEMAAPRRRRASMLCALEAAPPLL